MRFLFLRHPQTIANEIGYIYGQKDYPYTELGNKQVEAVEKSVSRFKVDQIISSPLGRAKLLAEPVSDRLGKPVIFDDRLMELNYGILEGLTVEEAWIKHPHVMQHFMNDEPDYTIPEGETYDDFNDRIQSFLEEYLKTDQRIMVVSHGGVIRTAIEYLMDVEPGFSWQLEVGNCSIIELDCSDGYHTIKNIINLDS